MRIYLIIGVVIIGYFWIKMSMVFFFILYMKISFKYMRNLNLVGKILKFYKI